MINQQQIGPDQLVVPMTGIAYILSVLQSSLLALLPNKKLVFNQAQQESSKEDIVLSLQALQNLEDFLEKGIDLHGVEKVCAVLSNTFSLLFSVQNNPKNLFKEEFKEEDINALCEAVIYVANKKQNFCGYLLFKSKVVKQVFIKNTARFTLFNGGALVNALSTVEVVNNSHLSLSDSEKARQRFFAPSLWHKFLMFIHVEEDHRKKLSAVDWVKALVDNKCTLQELANSRQAVEKIAAVFIKAFNGKKPEESQAGFVYVCNNLKLSIDEEGLTKLLLVVKVFQEDKYRNYRWLAEELMKSNSAGISQPSIVSGLHSSSGVSNVLQLSFSEVAQVSSNSFASAPISVSDSQPPPFSITQANNSFPENGGDPNLPAKLSPDNPKDLEQPDFYMEIQDDDISVGLPTPSQSLVIDKNLHSPDFFLPIGSSSPAGLALAKKRVQVVGADDACSTPPTKISRQLYSPELVNSESDSFRPLTATQELEDDSLSDAGSFIENNDEEPDFYADLPPDTVDLRSAIGH
ncbi:MAG: hypothetical protein A2X78_05105 [Gammaproteobacteria bacterium GWE2_37_16]|nr:MAG: hypothetical protein A2X78_05105 [Gammaproteobacteria bacterium GWE2_37_16]